MSDNLGHLMSQETAQTIALCIVDNVTPEQLALKLNWPIAIGCMRQPAAWPVVVIQTVAQLPRRNIPCLCGADGCWLLKWAKL